MPDSASTTCTARVCPICLIPSVVTDTPCSLCPHGNDGVPPDPEDVCLECEQEFSFEKGSCRRQMAIFEFASSTQIDDTSVNLNHLEFPIAGQTYTWLNPGLFFNGKDMSATSKFDFDMPKLVTFEIWARFYERYERRVMFQVKWQTSGYTYTAFAPDGEHNYEVLHLEYASPTDTCELTLTGNKMHPDYWHYIVITRDVVLHTTPEYDYVAITAAVYDKLELKARDEHVCDDVGYQSDQVKLTIGSAQDQTFYWEGVMARFVMYDYLFDLEDELARISSDCETGTCATCPEAVGTCLECMPEHDYYLNSGFCGRKTLYWPLDDNFANVADARIQDYEGITQNSSQLGTGGFEFDNGYAQTEDPILLDMDFTVEFWVMPSDLRDDTYYFDSSTYYGPWITAKLYSKTSGILFDFGLRRDADNCITTAEGFYTRSQEWAHMTISSWVNTTTQKRDIYLYLFGDVVGSKECDLISFNNLKVGTKLSLGSPSKQFTGRMAHLSIWNYKSEYADVKQHFGTVCRGTCDTCPGETLTCIECALGEVRDNRV